MPRGSLLPEKVKAAVFDMDGLLIDSEPIWQDSEILIFGNHGLALQREDCMQTMGLRIDEVVSYWKERRPDALGNADDDTLVEEILTEVKDRIRRDGTPMPGALNAVRALSESMPVGLASSSFTSVIQTALKKLEIAHYFQVIHSAQEERKGKPAPDVYLSACKLLGVPPPDCLALEDSPGGVESALAAGMQVIAVPHPDHRNHPSIQKAHLILDSLESFGWPPA
ncbi:MAG: hypothetical protein CMN76_21120 [Spirochaetaceae bacterium]|nr:hypothetical protein [Spirochaetaceae bacterium]|tara:strand:+ start:35318 stop:35992 length:675 start_codon:yes stop_codon:yes gene_type:complete